MTEGHTASVLEAIFDDDGFNELLAETEKAAHRAHAHEQKLLAIEAELELGLAPFADPELLQAQAAEARRKADAMEQKLSAAAAVLAARPTDDGAERVVTPQRPLSLVPAVELEAI